jgi:SAM-dependent methyltransferase
VPLSIYSVYRRLQPIFRASRRRRFLALFQPTEQTTILDIGGYHYDWNDLSITPPITVLNIDSPARAEPGPTNFTLMRGDGRALPFADQSFDIVYSNSVIEHLPEFSDQQRFANEALRVGRAVYVQTPNRWFPIEPHFIAFGIHYLPKSLQRPLLRWCSVRGWLRHGDNVNLNALFDELHLLTHREMRLLFPGCDVLRERLGGLTKSFIAVRQPDKQP